MAYTKQNFKGGATLTASQMNNIDNALKSHDDDIASLKSGSGGGSGSVTVSADYTSGTRIATVNGTAIYVPNGNGVQY